MVTLLKTLLDVQYYKVSNSALPHNAVSKEKFKWPQILTEQSLPM